MTQAFNLSQLANKLNTSGQLNASTGLSSTVPVANGGTNLSTPGAAGNVLTSNGTAWVSQAASAGFSGANINAASASAITLTSASAQCQIVQCTSVANSIVNLPSATTLTYKGGPIFRVINNSQCNASIFLKDGAGNWIDTIPVYSYADITLVDNGTTAGQWVVDVVAVDATPAAILSASASLNTVTMNTNQYYFSMLQMTDSLLLFASESQTPNYQVVYFVAATITGNTFSFGTVVNSAASFVNGWYGTAPLELVRLSDTLAVVGARFLAGDGCGFNYWAGFKVAAITFAGNAITVGGWNSMNTPSYASAANNAGPPYAYIPKIARVSATSFGVVYQTSAANYQGPNAWVCNGTGNLNCTIGSVSGTTITAGTAITLSANNGGPLGLVNTSDGALAMTYFTCSSAGSLLGVRKAVMILVSGTVPTFGTPVQIDSTAVNGYWSSAWGSNQWMMGCALSATKAILPIPYNSSTGNSIAVGVFNISSNVITYVAGSQLDLTSGNTNGYFMPVFMPRAGNTFLVSPLGWYYGSISNSPNLSPSFAKYGINANDIPYLKQNYTLTWDVQVPSQYYAQGLTVPTTTTSTVAYMGYVVTGGASTSQTIYSTKVTVPA